jgi:hypothetical protein
MAPTGRMCREHFVSAKLEFDSRGSFGALFSGLGIPFPRCLQELETTDAEFLAGAIRRTGYEV